MNSHFHFLGICGTAMGAVAAAMVRRGFTVTGSDANVYPPMSTFLEEEGITLFEGYKASNIPPDADVIVIGNAMSRGNEEVEAVLQRRLRYLSLPETMKEYFLRGKRNYVVTGTHGKTTTTSMLAWLMEDSGLNPSFMIGGIARNWPRRPFYGFRFFRAGGRRVRHGVFRQTLQIPALPPGTGGHQQH